MKTYPKILGLLLAVTMATPFAFAESPGGQDADLMALDDISAPDFFDSGVQDLASCCYVACYEGLSGYYLLQGVTQNCRQYAEDFCRARGWGFKDAKWDSC